MQCKHKTKSAEEKQRPHKQDSEGSEKQDLETETQLPITDPLEPWSTKDIHVIDDILNTK